MKDKLIEICEMYRLGRIDRPEAKAALRIYEKDETRIEQYLVEVEDWITADDELRWRYERFFGLVKRFLKFLQGPPPKQEVKKRKKSSQSLG